MVKFRKLQFIACVNFILLLSTTSNAQQNKSLQHQLWQHTLLSVDDGPFDYNKLQYFLDNKGWKEWDEWSDTMNSNVLIDDTDNGYLQINRFYVQTTVGAYKNERGTYTILKDERYRYFNKSISSNRNLKEVLPKHFGITDFISDTI